MNTNNSHLVSVRGATCRVVPLALALALAATTRATEPAPAPAAPRDYTLFVGIDLALPRGGEFHRVVDASRDGFVIEPKRKRSTVSYSNASDLRISKGVKLSNRSAKIDGLKIDTFSREAAQAQQDAMNSYVLMNDVANQSADRAQGTMLRSNTNAPDPRSGQVFSSAALALEAFSANQPLVESGHLTASTFLFDKMRGRIGDTIEATFQLSSAQRVEHPYVLLVVDFGTEGDAKKTMRSVAARSLDHLDATPQAVKLDLRLNPAALPAGAELKNVSVNVYAAGQELATNLSERRVELTQDEAHKFFILEYLGTHKGQTRPPAAMLLRPKIELRQQIDATQLRQPFYVSVDKLGSLVALTADEAGTQKVPAAVDALVKNIGFLPALDKGVPVDGKLKVNPAELLE